MLILVLTLVLAAAAAWEARANMRRVETEMACHQHHLRDTRLTPVQELGPVLACQSHGSFACTILHSVAARTCLLANKRG